MKIFLLGIVAKVMERLHGRRQAGDADAGNVPRPGGAVRRIGSERAILQLLRCAAGGVKGDGVEVDATVRSVSHHESGRCLVEGYGEPEGGKGVASNRRVGERDDAVEIRVRVKVLRAGMGEPRGNVSRGAARWAGR